MKNEENGLSATTSNSLEVENAIFEAALSISNAEQRQAFLARTFRDDPEGLERILELIALTGDSSAFFLQSQVSRAELAEEILRENEAEAEEIFQNSQPSKKEHAGKVGRYTLKRKIGEGGSSEVYEALQDGMTRPVAVKIIRSGMDSDSVVSRFEAERKTLELMEHPNIARVLDAGRTREGRPFFVMELVRGPSICKFCDEEKLTCEERLDIFLSVCQGIQHAHQKGIIHRDVKPSNILVEFLDGQYIPKVIDFGIAKAIHGQLPEREGLTLYDQFLGTPAYMSPEQIDLGGMDIDTRADIYSLGALLYELLAGRPPFNTDQLFKSGLIEMRKVLLEENPPRPSETARQELGKLARSAGDRRASKLRGDLDWVIMKAMAKERDRRYLTVNNLVMDIRRYLQNEPVHARKPSRAYLVRKFILRNQVATFFGLTAVLALMIGLGTATRLYLRERDAVAEQARLKEEADVARSVETKLKQQAQARGNVSRAALLLSEGNIEEADQLLQKYPLESVEPWSEAAQVFRSVGRWNAILGRWSQAVHCFDLMDQASRSNPTAVIEGLDTLMIAPSFLEAGQRASYEEYRETLLDRHLPVENPLQAEHLIKVCTLLPCEPEMLERMERAAGVCSGEIPVDSRHKGFERWNDLALSMFYYRKGDFEKALNYSLSCLAVPDSSGSRATAARCVKAMALEQLGRIDEARTVLSTALADLREMEARRDEFGNPEAGFWFAWSVARILSEEASSLLAERQF